MKISTLFSDRLKSLGLVILLTGAVGATQAATHYVRMEGDATSWGSFAGADIVTSNTPLIIATDTYYFAKGTYTLTAIGFDPLAPDVPASITPSITTGAIYGGFSGSESTIDLTTRALSDKDGNGIVEPWEFTNETILKGSVPFDDLQGSSLRLLTVTGGEVNGVTFFNHFYYGQTTTPAAPFSGAIILGVVSSFPGLDTDTPENAGKMRYCTVRRLKTGANGPIMMTNSKSLVDHCLIEESQSTGGGTNGGGGAIYMYPFGGTVSNSVIRNNAAIFTTAGSGRAGAIYSAYNSTLSIPNYAIIQNCAIYNNTSGNSGGAMRLEGKNGAALNLLGGQVINCTIANNSSTGAGIASVEFIYDGQLMVNTVVVGDPKDEIRPQANNNYYSNCVYGSKNGSIVMLPGTDLTTGKVTADLKFKKVALSYSGAMFPGDLTFVQAVYDSIRSSNLTIVDPTSPAVTTPGLTTMPSAFTSNPAIIPTATIPATDLIGVSRTGNYTIGAYQYVPVSGVNQLYSDKVLNVIALQNSILINDQEGKVAIVYSASGQLLKKVSLKSNNEIVSLSQGFYIISVNNRVAKVVIK